MYILETEDKKTGLKDGSATAGRNFFVRGAMLKVAGSDESVGVTLTNADKTVTKLTDDLITINNPSSLTLLLPAELTEGEYTLTITTQYSSSGTLLKHRVASARPSGSVGNRLMEVTVILPTRFDQLVPSLVETFHQS